MLKVSLDESVLFLIGQAALRASEIRRKHVSHMFWLRSAVVADTREGIQLSRIGLPLRLRVSTEPLSNCIHRGPVVEEVVQYHAGLDNKLSVVRQQVDSAREDLESNGQDAKCVLHNPPGL